jgi:FKBP-type peptidyl-prolyl cis-trans isomerase FklB
VQLKWITLALWGLAGSSLALAQATGEGQSAFKTRAAQESYAIGAQTARTLRKDGVEIDAAMLVQGLKDGLGNGKLKMDEKELRAVMSRVQQDVHKNSVLNRRALGERNKEEGARLLAENGKREGVVTTASGLQYKVLNAGSGAKPFLNNTVLVNYRGTLPNGTEIETSPDGKPGPLVVARSVNGLKEALQLMPVGSHWQLMVPASLAYGDRGASDEIGPNQLLQYDIELVGIVQTTGAN